MNTNAPIKGRLGTCFLNVCEITGFVPYSSSIREMGRFSSDVKFLLASSDDYDSPNL
jgi:hypothetical protein